MKPPLKPGDSAIDHAIILDVLPLREADRLVVLLTQNFGRLPCLARGAARSKKRFGGLLDPGIHVKAHFKIPRDNGTDSLIVLEHLDLENLFAHLRTSLPRLEAAAFGLRFAKDLLPERHNDPQFFRALGRFLRDGLGSQRRPELWVYVFWMWAAQHLGLGDLTKNLVSHTSLGQLELRGDFDCAQLESLHSLVEQLDERIVGARLYETWLERSGLRWPFWEAKLQRSSGS